MVGRIRIVIAEPVAVAAEPVAVAAEPVAVAAEPVADAGSDDVGERSHRAADVIARGLRDAGIEVIYAGLRQTPEQIVQTVIQEDADALGLSIGSGAHLTACTRTLGLLADAGADDVLVFNAGDVPDGELIELERLGVATTFPPAATTDQIVEWVRGNVAADA